MNSFDELRDGFGDDESDQEWDAAWAAYTSGAETVESAVELPLVGLAELPIGVVEIRGEDVGLSGVLPAVVEPRESSTRLIFNVSQGESNSGRDSDAGEGPDGSGFEWSICDSSGSLISGGESRELDDLAAALIAGSIESDIDHVYVNATLVQVPLDSGPRIVVVIADDGEGIGQESSQRIEPGLLAIRRGSRTVTFMSAPKAGEHSGGAVLFRSSVVDAVVFLTGPDCDTRESDSRDRDTEPGNDAGSVGSLAPQNALGRLFEAVVGVGDEADLEPLASLVARARCLLMPENLAADLTLVAGELNLENEAPSADRLEHDLVAVSSTSSSMEGSVSTGLARFETGAVVVERDDGELSVQILDGADADSAEERTLGTSLSAPLSPLNFALAGSVLGSESRRAFARARTGDLPGETPPGLGLELIARQIVDADEAERERFATDLWSQKRRLLAATNALERFSHELATNGAHTGVAVLTGGYLDAIDGPLPAKFFSLGVIRLLVQPYDETTVSEVLIAAGLHPAIVTMRTSDLRGGTSKTFEWNDPDHGPVALAITNSVASGPFGALVDTDYFHEHVVPIGVGCQWMSGLHPAHRFIHACLRIVRDSDDPRPKRSAVMNAPRTDAAIQQVVEWSEACGALSQVRGVVEQLQLTFPGIPDRLVQALG